MTHKFVGKAKFTSEPAAAFDPTLEGCSDPTPADIAAEKARQAGPALSAALVNIIEWLDRTGESWSISGKEMDYVAQARMAIEEATK